MKKIIVTAVLFLYTAYFTGNILTAQTTTSIINQKLEVVFNSGITGGEFTIEYLIKVINIPAANTLASLNADISYDSNTVRFISGINWNENLNSENGYNKNIKSNPADSGSIRWVRISVVAPNLNSDGSGQTTGFNISVNYTAIVRLNFIILDNTKSVSISVNNTTNQAGFFLNPSNSPNTFEISDQILAPPENITEQPLPVNLASFSAGVHGRDVKLEWRTSFEENNSGFDLERKSLKKGNWDKIAFIAGCINKNSVTEYEYSDRKLVSGEYNYRLKQIDINGNYHYFELNSVVKIGTPDKFIISQNYPNPFNSMTKIEFGIPYNTFVNLILYDITGREVRKIISNKEFQSGYYTIDFDAGDLPSGTYFYQFSADNSHLANRKLTFVK